MATGAVSLELLNVQAPVTDLRSGDQMRAQGGLSNAPSADSGVVMLVAKDALNQRVCGKTEDSGEPSRCLPFIQSKLLCRADCCPSV